LKHEKLINTGFRLAGIILAIGFVAMVLVMAKANPFDAFGNILKGAFSSEKKIADSLVIWVPLIITTCGLVITFTVGLWNIGIEGQIALGAILATWAIRLLQDLRISPTFVITAAIIAGITGGMLWALIAGILKFFGGVSEIFAGLGLNFIATALTIYLIFGPWKRPGVASMSGTVPFDEAFRLPNFTGLRLSPWSLILALLSVAVVFLLLNNTIIGLRMKAVGKNPKAAKLMGISSPKYMLLAFLLCGLFAGLTGALQVTAVYYRLIPSISSGYGFMGLLVAMLVNYQVLWAVPVAFLFAVLNIGGIQLPIEMKLDSTLSGVIQSALVLFYLIMDGIRNKVLIKLRDDPHE
jgi:general nucleoside transport system permease protein